MFRFRGGLIGVDIGSHTIKVVKLGGSKKKGYTLEAASCMESPRSKGYESMNYSDRNYQEAAPALEGGEIGDALGRTIKAQKLHGRRVAALMSGPSLFFRHLTLPQMPSNDLKEAVVWEIRKEAPFPPNELVADYVLTGRESEQNKLSLIAFGTRKGDMEGMVNTFQGASLEVEVLDVLPTALLAAFDMNDMWEQDENYGILNIGTVQSTLAVFKDRHLRFVRAIPYGGVDLTRSLARGLGVTEAEAEADKLAYGLEQAGDGKGGKVRELLLSHLEGLGSEITRSFDYYTAQYREGAISKLFLCGGTACLTGIEHHLSDLIDTHCFIDDPLRSVKIPPGFDTTTLKAIAPCLSVATGLATRRTSQ